MDERLEEIKEKYMSHEYDYNLGKKDIEYLIQQAEKVPELEETNKSLSQSWTTAARVVTEKYIHALEKENQLYKEILEDIARWDEMLYSTSEVGIKARQALKGESS